MRRVRRKGGNKEKVFGCDLMEHLSATSQDIPVVLRSCSEFVESHGIVDGIYRLSGVSSNIQKLRSEFESDASPELNKDTYLQDIHCVSSLCKAYFRELPNPLLTYQLYDKFAEAVALQLEEERLVKIRDVLKELPPPHYRTLEFLMRHLVRVASFSSETNMHSRNLAIVWAPNLLRSKEIEVSGFNGTAAFMEVRVQSIVVEFILTHVPQLFPEPGVSTERRKSLPSPSLLSNQDEPFFKLQPTINIGNLSPGDGPLAIRPYHAIIEGTDKRKGSLKGRKWMSIFNIGGRFHETRRRHKHSTKEKEHPTLRSARSMDSLSPSNNDPKRSPRPPSTHLSPLSIPQPQPSTKPEPAAAAVSSSPRSGSEYAVTYRRGTGLVNAGSQGTYTSLDPGPEAVQARSPGLSSKAGRRIAMHITGPTTVTVPLHITSSLALGVLQRGGADRVVHRARDKDGGDMKSERKGSEVDRKEGGEEAAPHVGEDDGETDGRGGGGDSALDPRDSALCVRDSMLDPEEVFNSTEVDDLTLSGYVQDNFDFLDQMDCSIMDCGVSKQMNEFSVEPPGHYDEEYEVVDHSQPGGAPPTPPLPVTAPPAAPPALANPARLPTVDIRRRHNKSLSLPYLTTPVPRPSSPSSSDDEASDDDQDYISSSDDEDDEDDENMFMKSLPCDFFLSNLPFGDGRGLGGANLDDEEQDEPEEQASKGDEDEVLVEEESETKSVIRQTKESTDEESHDVESETMEVQKEELDVTEELAERENRKQDLVVGQSSTEDEKGEDVLNQTIEATDRDLQCVEGETVVMKRDGLDGSGDFEDLEVQLEQEVVPEEEKREQTKDDPHEEMDATEPSSEPADGGTGEATPTAEATDQVDHELYLQMDAMDTGDHVMSHNSLYQDKEEITGSILSIEEVCVEVAPPELDGGGDVVVDIVKERCGNDDMFEDEIGQRETTRTHDDVWDELEDVICKVIEDMETHAKVAPTSEDNGETEPVSEAGVNDVENEATAMQEDQFESDIKLQDGHFEARRNQDVAEDANLKDVVEKPSQIPQNIAQSDNPLDKDIHSVQGVGSKVVTSKPPKVYQAKAVPVVPPKPQHCKLTALMLRQQQQQQRVHDDRRFSHGAEAEEQLNMASRAAERRRDGEDTSRQSPQSMCFDEAVAIATLRRGKGRESERDRQKE
ncbi:rho GTPase-activating protein 30 [Eucyclogobius newberryi]|uniref:rho GTPase-activating protein 30 n=1 Tax=Eucyclogobius newberryi TaxID=166745 RepID=UPI003B59CD07